MTCIFWFGSGGIDNACSTMSTCMYDNQWVTRIVPLPYARNRIIMTHDESSPILP